MDRVSRPLIGLLVATVAVFALWIIALKPSSSSNSSSGGPSTSALQSAIASAHQAVTTSNNAGARDGAPVTTTPATSATPAATQAQTAAAEATIKLANATNHRVGVVTAALRAHKVLALLFYNPAATDDLAVKQELKTVPTHGRRVVKLAAPVGELARYAVVSNQIPVSFSPTLVLIDRSGRASTIVGFADRFEIAQRVTDALATRP